MESTETTVERVLLYSVGGRILAAFLVFTDIPCWVYLIESHLESRLLTLPLLTWVRMKDYIFVVGMCVCL